MAHAIGSRNRGGRLPVLAVLTLLALSFARPLRAAESPTTFIAGRVLSIAADGKTLVVNRGRAEKVIPGSAVIVRPNRGVVAADIEWDLVYAKGVIDSVDEERSTVRLTEVREPLQVRDYCQIESGLPESLFESDLGRIAFYDVILVDRVKDRPLFTLKELAADPSPKALEAITKRILDEIRSTPADVIDGKYRLDVIRTGPFVGQPLRDAFAKATLKDVVRFIEYTASFTGGRVGYTWPVIDLYADWAFTGAPSGEREKKGRLAAPLVTKADGLLESGDLQGALAEYRNALAVDPENAAAQARIKTVTAVLERRKALEDDPKDVAARRALGMDLFSLRLYEESLAELVKARDLGEDSAEVASYIGYAHAALNHYAEARQALEPLAARFPDDAGVRKWLDFVRQNEILAAKGADVAASLAIGDIKLGEGDWDEAIRRYNDALDLAPRDTSIWERITRAAARRRAAREEGWAESYWKNGEYENALTCWETALDIVRGIPDRDAEIALLKDMAALKHDSGQFAAAIEDYQAILALDPKDAATEINAARACDGLGQHAEAERWARSGIAKSPADAWGYNVLGTIQENAGQIDQAMASYRKAAEIKATYKDPLYNLGVLTARRGEYEAAGEIFRRVLGIDPSYGSARDRLVEVEAVLECRGLLRQAPKDEGARRRLVKALFELEDYVRTAAELKDVLAAPEPPAWALEMEGKRLVRQGRFAEGRSALEKSLVKVQNPDVAAWVGYTRAQELLAAAPDDPEAQVKLGDDSFYWGSYDAALSAWGKAQELGAAQADVLERMERARKGLEAQRLLNLGTDAYNRAQYENALDAARRSESLYVEIGARRGRIEALLRAGWSQASLFRHDEALKAYQEAGRLAGEIGDDGLAAKVLITLGGYYSGIGEYEKALQASEQAADLWHRANDFLNEAWSALPTIGRVKGRLGDTAAERACYAKALAIHQRIVYPWGEASCQISLASTFEWEGDFAGAIDAYTKALAIAKSRDHRPAALDAYAGLETIYARIGDVANARKYGRLFLELAQAMGRKWERANALNKLGLIELENVKDYARAHDYFVESRDLARLTGDRIMEGVALANMAVVLSRQGNYREALAGEEEALRIVREVKDKFLEMQGLNEKGETHLGLKEYDAALDCQVKAREIAVFLGARAEQWQYELAAGKIHEAKGDLERAIVSYKQACETLKGIKAKMANEAMLKTFSDQERPADVYKRIIALLLKLGRTEEAFAYTEESKSKIVQDAFAGLRPDDAGADLKQTLLAVDQAQAKKEALESELRDERKKPEDQRDAKKVEILTRTLASTEGEFNQWMLKLKFQNRKMYDALSIKPATLGDVQGQVPPGAVFLEYFIAPEEIYVFCIGRDFFLARSAAVAEKDLETLVSRYVRLCMEPPSGPPDERMLTQGRKLFQILVAPVEDVVAKYETVVIIPFGALYYLPFHALVANASGPPEYLIERKRICYTTSATFADILKNEARGHGTFMGFGNPDGSLPAAAAELGTLRDKIFKSGAKVFTAGAATKAAFFEQAKNADILHLATHGFLDEADPLASYLQFAGASKEAQELTLSQIASYTALRERNSLVFLSACQTAREEGAAGSGSELITLAEAFAMAGAPTLVATLWKVEDRATRLLAETFYDQLANKGRDKLEALRAGELGLIRSAEFAHPFYWASFLLIGSWR